MDTNVETIVHELRTPVCALHASLLMLLYEMRDQMPADALLLLDVAEQSCGRIERIVSELLGTSSHGAAGTDTVLVVQPIIPLVEQTLQALRCYARASKVTVRLQTRSQDIWIAADCDRLIQVLFNLLANAIKFSHPGSTVTLRILATASAARISVTDHGDGIPHAFRNRIFQRYERVRNDTNTPGNGIGLSICKSIVQQHGGKIDFRSAPGRGSKFYVDLPLASASMRP
jgi:signal transduction histidine kinase